MSAAQILAERAARRAATVARPPAAVLASMRPLSPDRRMRLVGCARAADIVRLGVFGAARGGDR